MPQVVLIHFQIAAERTFPASAGDKVLVLLHLIVVILERCVPASGALPSVNDPGAARTPRPGLDSRSQSFRSQRPGAGGGHGPGPQGSPELGAGHRAGTGTPPAGGGAVDGEGPNMRNHEPPGADPHARWCGEGGPDTRPYPNYVLRQAATSFFTLSSLRCCSACQSSYWDC